MTWIIFGPNGVRESLETRLREQNRHATRARASIDCRSAARTRGSKLDATRCESARRKSRAPRNTALSEARSTVQERRADYCTVEKSRVRNAVIGYADRYGGDGAVMGFGTRASPRPRRDFGATARTPLDSFVSCTTHNGQRSAYS